ncbi:putative trans-sialidase, Group V [Trypanosoma cruzi]|uniref:Putative trans-sialidase, Group V n=1 Tax=Trypanosoma cruzi TaxID=5693 RepID=A0A2V2X3A4_TRYCR|nr:putative trans-sialidase, Group V [Trypanosoma cruzi]
MLSRVAAVMAPRTHNRRRVTGSSGRRRERRESEPQRPNMSRHLFYSAVLLVLVMMCCGTGGAAQAAGQPSGPSYKWKDIKDDGVTVESLGAPGLLKVGSNVFAVAEAQCKRKDENSGFNGIASQIITKQTADKEKEEVLNEVKETQVLEEVTSEDRKKVDVSRPTTVVKGSDIYMLVGKYSQTAAGENSGAKDGGLLLVQGNVSDGSGGEKRIHWKDTTDVPRASVGELDLWTGLIGSGGSGVKMHDDTLVFPVEGTKKKGEAPKDEKTVSLLIYTSGNAASWTLSKEVPDGGCSDPSVVEWKKEDKKLMMMTACDDGRRRVYESGDKGDSWTEALGTLSRVWGNKQGKEVKGVRSGFITATIDGEDNRNVMLVTLPVYSKEADTGGNGKGKLHLWLTDNTHIVDIGPVSDDDAAASSLLYKSAGDNNEKEELIALYEKKKGDGKKPSPGMVSVLLTAQLQRVKDVLATWKKVDERVSKLCPSIAERDRPSDNACSPTVKITDGLVGFLSGNFSKSTWRDEYLGVNATVKDNDGGNKATLHEGGVKFTGAWAEWPVGSQGENQLFHFANYNFTLVATVSIDGVPQEGSPIPLMGVKTNGAENTVLLGLSYSNNEKKWMLLCGSGNRKELSSALEPGKTRQLAIVLQNDTQGSAYVDGKSVGDAPCELKVTEPNEISHFYIGGDVSGAGSEEDVSVTVRNVLLYNRPLDGNEVEALKPNEASSLPSVNKNGQGNVIPSFSGEQQKQKGQPLGKNGAGGVPASTSAVSTVKTSPAGKESVKHLASGTYPDGHQNVDGGSTADSYQTVDTRYGDKTQEDGALKTPMDNANAEDANAPTNMGVGQDGTTVTPEVGASSAEDEETVGRKNVQGEEGIHPQAGNLIGTALNSSLGNLSQGNNSDAGTVCGSGLPSLLLLLGLWVFAAL